MQKMSRNGFFGIIAIIFLLGSIGYGAFYFPLQLRELQMRYEFWRFGVHKIQKEGWSGYWKDDCQASGSLAGQGCSCVVLVHGWGDDALTWQKILLWPQEGWEKLGMMQRLRIFAVNLPGSGQTLRFTDLSRYRVRQQAQKLRTVLESLCSDPWIVVGQGSGGWIAAWLGLDWPAGVGRLVLLDSFGLSFNQNTSFLGNSVEEAKDFQKKAYFKPKKISEREWESIVQRMRKSNIQDVVHAQTEQDYLDLRLPALRRPTLLFWGREDQIVPLRIGQQMRALIPGVLWREAYECGHFPQQECPLLVIQAIADMVGYGAM